MSRLPEHLTTKIRRDLVEWLEDQAPSFLPIYVGAVQLLHTPDLPGRVHFVCHAIRDIYRHLPGALGTGLTSRPRPSDFAPDMVMQLAERWRRFPPAIPTQQPLNDQPVSAEVYAYLQTIIDKCNEVREQWTVGQQLAVALFRSLGRAEDEFIPRWVIDAFDAEYKFFVKRAHVARSVDKMPTDDGLAEHFEAFERAFHSLVGPYFQGKEELDAILHETNATTD